MESLAGRDHSRRTEPDREFIFGSQQTIADGGLLEARTALMGPGADIPERGENRVVEGGRTREIDHCERQMMKHRHRRSKA